jgi:hypothetical protein
MTGTIYASGPIETSELTIGSTALTEEQFQKLIQSISTT